MRFSWYQSFVSDFQLQNITGLGDSALFYLLVFTILTSIICIKNTLLYVIRYIFSSKDTSAMVLPETKPSKINFKPQFSILMKRIPFFTKKY